MKDLVVLVADKNMECAIRGIVSRGRALAFRTVDFDIYVHPERDPGCLRKAHIFLRPFSESYAHALVAFDRQGCGREEQTRQDLESEVEGNLARSGWDDRAACVVIDPELEVWVWSDSPHVESVLGWEGQAPRLRDWLQQQELWLPAKPKPLQPKDCVEKALRRAGKPRSSSLYLRLARLVSMDRCSDGAFRKLKNTLSRWFPAEGVSHDV